ncbi:hypothetical protein ACFVVX_26840 [Kitasatospora sp. NPDC058170]|uniref:hypothetical protein n=1 Tax=Kitasatospora sp. NPDC058170 TaxID=3346364 RepID=UPI0036D8FCE9
MAFPSLAEAAEQATNGDITMAAVLSALGGVTVTGLFGIWLAFINRSAQRQQAEIQASRDLKKWHRELRRQSYADCVVAFERFRDVLSPLAEVLPWPVPQAMSEGDVVRVDGLIARLREAYDDAFQKCQVVRLEGPDGVSEAVQRMLFSMAGFRNAAEERVRAAKDAQRPPEPRAWDEAAAEMHSAVEDFMTKASAVVAAG